MPSWIGPVVVALLLLLVGVGFVAALRRARRRRAQEYAEDEPGRIAEQRAPAAPAPAKTDEPIEAPAIAPVEEAPEPAPSAKPRVGKDATLSDGLAGTRTSFFARLGRILERGSLGPEVLHDLEDALLLADVGVAIAGRLTATLRAEIKARGVTTPQQVRSRLKQELLAALSTADRGGDPLALGTARPHIILFVGVNGVGKTTTIGKIAAQLRDRGHQVVLAAGDTFRAAAAAQLAVWAERTGSALVRGEAGADPASVAYRAVEEARKGGADVVLVDTAGRMHTKSNLMDELKKVKRSLGKVREQAPDQAPDQTWLVVDATTGQNALQQAREFHSAVGVTGIILTKLDGTAKGGVVVAIADALHLPIAFVGVGEKIDDLKPFSAAAFVDAVLA